MSGRNERNTSLIIDEVKLNFINAINTLRLEIELEEVERIWSVIVEKYNGRQYHNLEHVKYSIDKSFEVLRNPNYNGGTGYYGDLVESTIRLALIYHDVEQGIDHEQRSYDLFSEHFNPYFEEDESIKWLIQDHILITKHSDFEEERDKVPFGSQRRDSYGGGSVIVKDADLSILGETNVGKYVGYWWGVREEILGDNINDQEQCNLFLEGRIIFLEDMLTKSMIYRTRAFGLLYEWYARENMLREIAMHKLTLSYRNEE